MAESADRPSVDAVCKVCGTEFRYTPEATGRRRKFCGPSCKQRDKQCNNVRYRLDGRYRDRLWVTNPKRQPYSERRRYPKICVVCDQVYEAVGSNHRTQMTCSHKCGNHLAHEVRGGMSIVKRMGTCESCGRDFLRCRGNREQKARGYVQRHCGACSPASRDIGPAIGAEVYRKERLPFDPIAVLERDGWICYLCGVPTPRELRGTTFPIAPEVDHVIPLSRHGAHSEINARCACRRCNLDKRDQMLGFRSVIAAFAGATPPPLRVVG